MMIIIGFLHSGDVAAFDENKCPRIKSGEAGFMKITGRKKELIITAGGENIPPVLIENEIKAVMSCISNCMVIGDKRKFLSVVLSLKVMSFCALVYVKSFPCNFICTSLNIMLNFFF